MATTVEVGNIQARITATTGRFDSAIRRVNTRLGGVQKTSKSVRDRIKALNRSFDDLHKRLEKAGRTGMKMQKWFGAALAAQTAAVTVALKQAATYASEVNAVAGQTGIAVESIQALNYAVQQSDGDIGLLNTGLRALARRSAEAAQGNRTFAKYFDQLGVKVQNLDGSMRPLEDILMDVADRVQALGSESEASAALMGLMGDAGRQLVPMMRRGSSGIRGLMHEARSLGLVLDRETISRLTSFSDQMNKTRLRMGALSREWALHFLPLAERIIGRVDNIVRAFQNLDDEQKALIFRFGALAAAVMAGGLAFSTVLVILPQLVRGLQIVIGVMGMFASPWVLAVAGVVAAAYLLKKAWDENLGGIRDKTKVVVDAIESAWSRVEPLFSAAWNWVIDTAGTAWKWLTETTWAEKVEDVKGWLSTAWEWTVGIAGSAWSWLVDTSWADKMDAVRGWLSSAWAWTLTLAGGAWAWIEEHLPWVAATVETLAGWLGDAWSWTLERAGDAWDWIEKEFPGFVTLFEEARSLGTLVLSVTLEKSGELFDLIKSAMETGDWSEVIQVGADVWRAGVKIAVSLVLAHQTATAALLAIKSGLGVAAGASSLGVPGAIGVLSIVVALAEAQATGDYEAFGANLIAALAVGIGIGKFTGSPYLGALAFTIVLNFEIGEWIGDKLKELDESPTMKTIRRWLGTESDPMTLEVLRDPGAAAAQFAAQMEDRPTELRARSTPWEEFLGRITSWRNARGWQSGTPWTGHGPLNEVAGVVHRQEAVIPADVLRAGPGAVLEFLGAPGFQGGKLGAPLGVAAVQAEADRLTQLNEESLGQLTQMSGILDGLSDVWDKAGTKLEQIASDVPAVRDLVELVRTLIDLFRAGAAPVAPGDGGPDVPAAPATFMDRLRAMLGSALDWLKDQGQAAGEKLAQFGSSIAQALTPIGMLTMLLDMLSEPVQALLMPITMVVAALGKALVPVFKAAFPIIKTFGIILLTVLQGVSTVWNAIVGTIGNIFKSLSQISIFGWRPLKFLEGVGDFFLGLQVDTKALSDAQKELRDLTWEEAMERAKNIDAIKKTTDALRNVPSGFKVALARFQAATPVQSFATGGYVPATPGGRIVRVAEGGEGEYIVPESKMGRSVVVNVDLRNSTIYGVNDLDRRITTAVGRAMRQSRMAAWGVT